MVDVAERAISLANEGEWDALVELPEGVTRADTGERWASVWWLVERLHLDDFLTGDEDDEWQGPWPGEDPWEGDDDED
jgi:hypothetical protein